nr:membrane protein E3 [Equid gammaherpesvirus 5]
MLFTRALVFLLCWGCVASTTTATTTDTSTPSPTTSSTPTSPSPMATTQDPTLPCEMPTLSNGNVIVTMNYSVANYSVVKNLTDHYPSSKDNNSTWLILGFSFTCNSKYTLVGNATTTCLLQVSGTVYNNATPGIPFPFWTSKVPSCILTPTTTQTTETTRDTTTPEPPTTRPPWLQFGYAPLAMLVVVLVIFITLVVVHCVMKC